MARIAFLAIIEHSAECNPGSGIYQELEVSRNSQRLESMKLFGNSHLEGNRCSKGRSWTSAGPASRPARCPECESSASDQTGIGQGSRSKPANQQTSKPANQQTSKSLFILTDSVNRSSSTHWVQQMEICRRALSQASQPVGGQPRGFGRGFEREWVGT